MTVAVVAIATEFAASIAAAAATVVMMNVAMAFAMPLAGVWSARLGPRRLIVLAGIVVFGSSVLLALAPNIAVLALARAAQGIGIAAVEPLASALVALREHTSSMRVLGSFDTAGGQ